MLYRRLIINGEEYPIAVNQAGQGAPSETTVGAQGVLYMDTDTEKFYKCTAAIDGVYIWKELGASGGSGSGGNVDLTGYATEQYVKDYAQPKGDYLTAVPDGYAKTEDIPTKPEDIGAQPSGNYLTEVPSGYATEEFVKNKIAEAELGGEEVDLSGYAQKSELPTKVSQLKNDSGYLTAVPDEYAKTADIPTKPSDIGAQPEGDYALRSEIPSVPVKSVNGKTGAVSLSASDVKARPDTWMPSASDVGALPNTTKIPAKTSDLTNDSGFITGYTETDPTVPAWAKNATKPSYSKSEVGLGNVDNVKQYSASNPPPYPVTSVNGKTGAVQIEVPKFDPTVYRLPILYLTGSTAGMTKDNAVTLSYVYGENSGSCTLKWQGSSSLAWDKKNYTIKFGNAFEAVEGWGAQSKYCLKANWIDHSHSRNVVSAKLWGLIRKNRSNLPAKLKALPNAGAIDGFPVVVMLNGEFHGLYSFNIPKDAWMFGMGSGAKEAIVTADNQAEDTAFKAETLLDADGLELEYNSSGFSATAVKDSFNALINACINSYGGDLDTEVAKYLDWESAIDYYIFTVIIKGGDMIQKNAMYATFDGVKWYFSAYDMDTTYGLAFDGSALDRAVSNVTFDEAAGDHRVFELIKRFKTNELKARYNELRANALSETRICQYFENYAWDISSPLLVEEVKRWPSVRGSSVNGIDQICRWVRQRLEATDAWANALPAQETPVEPEKPVEMVNLVPTSTDTDGSIYNGTGYKDNARLSSSGGVSGTAQTGSVVTGFIPVGVKDIIRIKGATWVQHSTSAEGHYYINFYKADKTFIDGLAASTYATNKTPMSIVYDDATGVTTFDITDNGAFETTIKDAAYFRINACGKGADLIVTVNQEIT